MSKSNNMAQIAAKVSVGNSGSKVVKK